MVDQRYPIGRFCEPEHIEAADLQAAIATIEGLPAALRAAVADLSDGQINTPHREGGWTVRQLVHHVADSHMNAFIRVRLALTEDIPSIKSYNEKAWAELGDSAEPVEPSLMILEGLHARWARMLQSLTEAQWKRKFRHPENGTSNIEQVTLLYQWHCAHHTAHIVEFGRRSAHQISLSGS